MRANRPSSEPRDRGSVHQPGRPWSNRGRCLDCHKYTRNPELCYDCLKGLCS